jgi:UDP-N-acetylglucosamine 2-epimerase
MLVGTSRDRIVREVSRLLTDAVAYKEMSHKHNPYGDGKAAKRIVKEIMKRFASKGPGTRGQGRESRVEDGGQIILRRGRV